MNKQILAIGIIFLFISIGTIGILSVNQESRIVDTKCYDRNYNEIKGLICEENQNIYFGTYVDDGKLAMLSIILVMVFFIGIMLIILGIIENDGKGSIRE